MTSRASAASAATRAAWYDAADRCVTVFPGTSRALSSGTLSGAAPPAPAATAPIGVCPVAEPAAPFRAVVGADDGVDAPSESRAPEVAAHDVSPPAAGVRIDAPASDARPASRGGWLS